MIWVLIFFLVNFAVTQIAIIKYNAKCDSDDTVIHSPLTTSITTDKDLSEVLKYSANGKKLK